MCRGCACYYFSLDYNWNADFSQIREHVIKSPKALKEGIPKGNALNVNFPKLKKEEIKGIKVCRHVNAYWIENLDKRTNLREEILLVYR